ncbi:MAG TPA: hypothetical protein VFJ64_04535 [Solirubrobacterales bacterium]|nr:hypothetical protein [Solirubrobacterales bacterium]
MSSPTPSSNVLSRRDPLAVAALLVALLALVFSLSGQAPAKRQASGHQKHGAGKTLARLKTQCPIANAIKFGSWCLEAAPYRVPPADVGQNDYFYAAQTCAREGGWLPSAAQLIGAASKAPLQSTIDDDPATSGREEFPDPTRGFKDKREMSADLFTTTAGSAAAGSEGVTVGSRGNQAQGEPDPVPMPANPSPETLQYVTVYDNHNHGGFAGGAPVGKPENFRCAFAVGSQGKPKLSAGN